MLKRLLVVLATLLLSATGARATVILSLHNGAPSESGGVWTYVYDATLQAGGRLQPTDFFTVYDFAGLLGPVDDTSFDPDDNLASLGTFSFGVDTAGSGPALPHYTLNFPPYAIADLASVPNVTVSLLSGPDDIIPAGTNVLLGTLTLTSSIGTTTDLLQVGTELRQIGPTGLEAGNKTFAIGPIPEPSTYAFMGVGLLTAGALARRAARNRKQQIADSK